MSANESLDESPPEAPPRGEESRFVTAFQCAHRQAGITDIRKALRHCALELALERLQKPLVEAVERALNVETRPVEWP